MNKFDIIEKLEMAGCSEKGEMMNVLLDGEAMSTLGITDQDKDAVEDAFNMLSEG